MATSIYRSMTSGVVSLIGLTSICVASPSYATSVSNGSFEAGNFAGWSIIGNNRIETVEFGSGPTQGSYEALITNGPGSASDSDLEAFLSLEAGSLFDQGNGIPTNGSAIKQTFTANAGDVLSFDWNFLKDQEPDPIFNDFAFFSLNSLSTLASPLTSTLLPFSAFDQQTGFQSSSFTIPTTGTYILGVGVVNVTDTAGDSGLLVDNFSVKPVPETSSVLGTLVCALGTWSLLKRRHKSAG